MTLSDVWKYVYKFFNSENKEKLVYFIVNIFLQQLYSLSFTQLQKLFLTR